MFSVKKPLQSAASPTAHFYSRTWDISNHASSLANRDPFLNYPNKTKFSIIFPIQLFSPTFPHVFCCSKAIHSTKATGFNISTVSPLQWYLKLANLINDWKVITGYWIISLSWKYTKVARFSWNTRKFDIMSERCPCTSQEKIRVENRSDYLTPYRDHAKYLTGTDCIIHNVYLKRMLLLFSLSRHYDGPHVTRAMDRRNEVRQFATKILWTSVYKMYNMYNLGCPLFRFLQFHAQIWVLHANPKLRNFSTDSAECTFFAFLKGQSCKFRLFKMRKL